MTKRWYIVQAYSNFENKVAESIREQSKQRHLEHLFEEVMVPKEQVIEVRRKALDALSAPPLQAARALIGLHYLPSRGLSFTAGVFSLAAFCAA